jgi:hypothetical protein
MKPETAIYPPLDVPKVVAEGVWIVDSGPISVMGMPLPVRMTVLKLGNGALVLHSPTRFDLELRRQLESFGRIDHLVAPNSAHWTFIEDWQSHLPGALTWAAPGLRRRAQVRHSRVRLDHDLGQSPPGAWSEEVDQIVVPGVGGFAEVALFHRGSRTLVLTDLVQNLEPEKLPRLIRPAAWLAGVTAPDGKAPIYLRAIVKLKGQEARNAAERLVGFEPARVIFAHGRWFQQDGTAQLRKSLAWLRG